MLDVLKYLRILVHATNIFCGLFLLIIIKQVG